MVHTLPDYTTKYKTSTITAIADNAELAARLGSIDTFDRRGNVIWMDNFEGTTLLWRINGGAGYTCVLNATYALTGSQSCKMTTGGVAANNWATIYRTLAYPVACNIGFEISSTYHEDILYYYWYMHFYTGALDIFPFIRYDDTNNVLQYYDRVGAWQTFATDVNMEMTSESFNTCKLVANFVDMEYERFIYNDVTYDLSGIALNAMNNLLPSRLGVYFGIVADGVKVLNTWADSAIVTQNEEAQ